MQAIRKFMGLLGQGRTVTLVGSGPDGTRPNAELLPQGVERRRAAPRPDYAAAMTGVRWLLWCGIGVLLPLLWPAWTTLPIGLRTLEVRMAQESATVDTSSWMRADFAATDWQALDQAVLANWRGPFWLQLRVELAATEPPPQALWISLRASSTAWWDGELLGHNGQPAARAELEIPGRIDWLLPLDRRQAAPGLHVLTLRASSQAQSARFSGADFYVAAGTLERLAHAPMRNWLAVAVACGGMLAALAFFAALVRRSGPPHRAALLLLALGSVAMLLLGVESARTLTGYVYPLHGWRLRTIGLLTLAAALLLPAYLAQRFAVRLPRWTWWSALVLGLIVLARPGSFDLAAMLLHALGLLASLLLLFAVWRRSEARRPLERVIGVLLACAAALLSAPSAYLDLWYFVGIGGLLVLLLVQHAELLAQARTQARQLAAEQARLQAELLRQSIQPHWLMNTLTALQELIESQPAEASRMVEALGREFALLRQLSTQALIPLTDELRLCRVHLDIMSMAQLAPLTLSVDGDPAGIEVPPGVLHTLVENALTHGGLRGTGNFDLVIRRCAHGVTLNFCAPAVPSTPHAHGQGTGSRFVHSSLAVSHPQRHRFCAGLRAGRWCSEIRLMEAGPPCAC